MIVDARSIEDGSVIETDLCIVGAGTAGIVLAREFIGHDLRVCLLESGGHGADPQTQSLAGGENLGLPYYPLDTARTRQLGGSSTLWHVPIGASRVGARLRPLDPIDFEARDWVPFSGWPFNKQHLDSHYDRAQTICGVRSDSFEPRDWETAASPSLQLPGNEVQTIIYKFVERDLFAVHYPEQVGKADNVTTFLHANVLEIETAGDDSVSALRVATLEGRQFSVKAKFFVLAAGGIEIPRLLLLSNKVQKDGLGNQHGLVGRFFMEHPHFWQGIFVPTTPDVLRSAALYSDVQTVNGVAIIGKLALTEATLRHEKLLNQNVQLMPHRMSDPFKYRRSVPSSVQSFKTFCERLLRGDKVSHSHAHLRQIVAGLNEVAAAGARKIWNSLAGIPQISVFYFANMSEQIPDPESRVTLGDGRDLFGQRRTQLNWKIAHQDVQSALRTQTIIGGALERAGLGRFFSEQQDANLPNSTEGGYHHMGTTRMHADPKKGVVNANCRVHGVGNLFVAGPSVFPTGGYANPVLTIVALTVRLADHLKKLIT